MMIIVSEDPFRMKFEVGNTGQTFECDNGKLDSESPVFGGGNPVFELIGDFC